MTKNKKGLILKIGIGSGIAILVFASLIGLALWQYKDKIIPGIHVNNILVGGYTKEQAHIILDHSLIPPKTITLAATSEDLTFEIDLASIDFSYDINKTVDEAFMIGRKPTAPLKDILEQKSIVPSISYSEDKLSETLSVLAGQISVEAVYPAVRIVSGEIVIEKGAPGQDIQIEKTKADMLNNLATMSNSQVTIEIRNIDPSINESEANQLRERAKKYIGKQINVNYEFTTIQLTDSDLVTFLSIVQKYDRNTMAKKASEIAKIINRDPQNSVFVFEEGRVKEFAPAKDGLVVNEELLINNIFSTLDQLENSTEKELAITIPVTATGPTISTSEVNNLGIKELIGRGTSRYRGSIPSRVHNVALASSRVSGYLVKPGEAFSFNNALGDVSKLTGYKEAYVIQDGKTVLGDGGGVCQVSTTLFRAVLNAGLQVSERRGHSYRVGYYEQDSAPGLDATVYSPTTDFKFINDTPGHILVQATADTKNMTLVFELYGTSDGRVATTTKPVMTNISAPPEDLYTDDPTLPAGQIRQTEHKAWGGRSTFNYEVKKGDQIVYQKTFVTNFRPWQAVYLRGTGPAQ